MTGVCGYCRGARVEVILGSVIPCGHCSGSGVDSGEGAARADEFATEHDVAEVSEIARRVLEGDDVRL